MTPKEATPTAVRIAATAVKIALIYITGMIVKNVARKSLSHMMAARERSPLNKFDHRRTKTITKLLDNAVTYTVNFIVIILILNQLGFELMPLLAGASVVGLAVGFGAQNLVKDVISGFFIIFEDQFAVGDVIQTAPHAVSWLALLPAERPELPPLQE